MDINVNEMQVYFATDVTTEVMNSQVSSLANPFKVLINTQLI